MTLEFKPFSSDKYALRHNHRVLHGEDLPGDERRRKIRISMGGQQFEKADQMLGAGLRRLSHVLGPGPNRRRLHFSLENRRSLSKELSRDCQNDSKKVMISGSIC